MAPVAATTSTLVRRQVCTIETCPIESSWYQYRPSLAANTAFIVIFGVSAIIYAIQGFKSRKFIAFSIAMFLGCVSETVGYAGRVLMWQDPWEDKPFMLQISCLTFAPAFLAAGIYFTLSRIVVTFGRENSRLPPHLYPWLFIPCDVLSLALQGAGGALASVADSPDGANLGRNVMIGGLVFQVVTLSVFITLAIDFSLRTWQRNRSMGEATLDPSHAALRTSFRFRGFLAALSLATLLIFTRCVFRVAELSEGWDGPLMSHEPLFIGLEGVVVAVSVVALNIFNPAYCFQEGYDEVIKPGKRSGSV